MVLQASQRYRLRIGGVELGRLDPHAPISLAWPRWYPDSAQDRAADAHTLIALVAAGQLSRETALRFLAPTYGVQDIQEELERVEQKQ